MGYDCAARADQVPGPLKNEGPRRPMADGPY